MDRTQPHNGGESQESATEKAEWLVRAGLANLGGREAERATRLHSIDPGVAEWVSFS